MLGDLVPITMINESFCISFFAFGVAVGLSGVLKREVRTGEFNFRRAARTALEGGVCGLRSRYGATKLSNLVSQQKRQELSNHTIVVYCD